MPLRDHTSPACPDYRLCHGTQPKRPSQRLLPRLRWAVAQAYHTTTANLQRCIDWKNAHGRPLQTAHGTTNAKTTTQPLSLITLLAFVPILRCSRNRSRQMPDGVIFCTFVPIRLDWYQLGFRRLDRSISVAFRKDDGLDAWMQTVSVNLPRVDYSDSQPALHHRRPAHRRRVTALNRLRQVPSSPRAAPRSVQESQSVRACAHDALASDSKETSR